MLSRKMLKSSAVRFGHRSNLKYCPNGPSLPPNILPSPTTTIPPVPAVNQEDAVASIPITLRHQQETSNVEVSPPAKPPPPSQSVVPTRTRKKKVRFEDEPVYDEVDDDLQSNSDHGQIQSGPKTESTVTNALCITTTLSNDDHDDQSNERGLIINQKGDEIGAVKSTQYQPTVSGRDEEDTELVIKKSANNIESNEGTGPRTDEERARYESEYAMGQQDLNDNKVRSIQTTLDHVPNTLQLRERVEYWAYRAFIDENCDQIARMELGIDSYSSCLQEIGDFMKTNGNALKAMNLESETRWLSLPTAFHLVTSRFIDDEKWGWLVIHAEAGERDPFCSRVVHKVVQKLKVSPTLFFLCSPYCPYPSDSSVHTNVHTLQMYTHCH